MIKLSTNYKIETARSLTELAIQNNLMSKYKNEADIIPMPCAGLMEFI